MNLTHVIVVSRSEAASISPGAIPSLNEDSPILLMKNLLRSAELLSRTLMSQTRQKDSAGGH